MVEKASQTNHEPNGSVKPAVHSMITAERAQKFDLLIHLIVNFRRPLIVCGPEGIGKSTLLNVLRERRPVDGYYCELIGDQKLNFETIREHLQHFLQTEQPTFKGFALDDALVLLERKKLKLVLIIDNAGKLVPGLVDVLSQYALANSALRIVFSLTQDELYIKGNSDRSIEDCHVIELPPLSEKQCREFLQNLSGKPAAAISFNAVSDSMVAHLYQETHGIPGRIIAELPRLRDFERKKGASVRFSFGAIFLAIGALFVFVYAGWDELFSLTDNDSELHSIDVRQEQTMALPLPLTQVKGQESDDSLPEPVQGRVMEEPELSPVDLNRTAKNEATVEVPRDDAPRDKDESEAKTTGGVEQASLKMPESEAIVQAADAKVIEKAPEQIATHDEPQDDSQWLFRQPPEHFTLQLMVLSSRQSILNVLNKYKNLQSGLKHIETTIGGKQKFILLFGTFTSHSEAGRAAESLPAEFRGAWVRRFAVLRNDIKKAE